MTDIPTYYAKLIKEHSEQLSHIKCRWNQLAVQLRYAVDAGKSERAAEIKGQMLERSIKMNAIREKIELYEAKR